MKKEELLSQEEIDALMQVFSQKTLEDEASSESELTNESSDGFPSRVDKKFQKQKKQFEKISELLNYSLVSSLSEFLKRDVVSHKSEVEKPVAYEDFLASMDNPSCVGVFTFQETRMTALLELDLNLAYSIVDIILGGKGDSYLKAKRALTDLELKLIRKPIEWLLLNMGKVLHLKCQLEELFTYSYQIRINSPYEIVVPLTLNVVEGTTREEKTASSEFIHRITFCIPQMAMESLFINQNTIQTDNKEESKYFLEVIKKSPFIDMPLRLQAQFPETEITIGRLMKMKIGDTIVLDANKDDDIIEVELSVEGCPKFKGKLGAIGRYKAVEIVNRFL